MYIFPVLSFIIAAIHLFLRRKGLSAEKTVEILLLYIFAITVGMANVYAFIGHAFFADRVAESIG